LVEQVEALNDAEADVRALKREVKKLRKENIDLSIGPGPNLEPIIRRIEIALERFPVERPESVAEDVNDRLEAVLGLIYQIREMFDEQRRGGDKRPTFSGSPRSSILRKSPRSPR
jgi:hypothetical protein